jgi:hypothetical protein
MNIPSETKDWTWVLSERCPECGFDTSEPLQSELAVLATTVADRWVAAIGEVDDLTARPDPMVWSPLEYACHVRDVLALARYRCGLMRDEDDPVFANWDQDVTAVEDDYASQDPTLVSRAIADNATVFSAFLADLPDDAWPRPGRRSDGAPFTVESFARYVLHDPIHHLTDITGQRWA